MASKLKNNDHKIAMSYLDYRSSMIMTSRLTCK